jgi:hypothetical protein
MRSRTLRVSSFSLVALLGVGCQPAPDIELELNDYATLLNETNSLACDCPEELGYSDSVECDQGMGIVGTTKIQCLANVLDGHEEAGKDYLDCANSTLQTFSQCLASDPLCEDDRFANCEAARMTADAACPQLASDIQIAFRACTE